MTIKIIPSVYVSNRFKNIPIAIMFFVIFLVLKMVFNEKPVEFFIVVFVVLFWVWFYIPRRFIAYKHHMGRKMVAQDKFIEAIKYYEESYDFFSRHLWLEKLHSVIFLSVSDMGYREMALLNIAVCHVKLDESGQAKISYNRVLKEFPKNILAKGALDFIKSIEKENEKNKNGQKPLINKN